MMKYFNNYFRFKTLFLLLLCCACTTTENNSGDPLEGFEELTPATDLDGPEPDPDRNTPYTTEQIEHGKYMVELLGCSSCHTDGALAGNPNYSRLLAGSRVGIAYSDPLKNKNPGVLYPANLTPDPETGLGTWSDEQIRLVLQAGTTPDGSHILTVMPWNSYSKLSRGDADSIVAYLRSLKPVYHKVPDNVAPGKKATEPYIHFGVYRSMN